MTDQSHYRDDPYPDVPRPAIVDETTREEDNPLDLPPLGPWYPQLDEGLSRDERISQAIVQAIGSGSMCWEDVKRAGLFNVELAMWVADGLYDFISSEIGTEGGEEQ